MRLTEEQTEVRTANFSLQIDEIRELIPDELKPVAKIVGKYVWLYFDSKPSAEILLALNLLGFCFAPKRRAWYHRCGNPKTRRAPYDPRQKYGEQEL